MKYKKIWKNKLKFNGVYSRNSLPKTKGGAYIINPDKYELGTRWIALYINDNNVTYFDSFGLKILQKKLENSSKIKILFQIFIECKHMIQ